MSATVLHGDCIEQMRGLDDGSVDSIVTDPPYELGFMGKSWDASGIANSVEMWREAYRVLKPGGHLLAFSATRTQHRMVCAIEDAGFEVRDQVGWLYGSGFPKSMSVDKAIDKAAGAEREVVGPGSRHGGGKDIRGGKLHAASDAQDDGYGCGEVTAPATPEAQQWAGFGTSLKPAWEPICVARKPLIGTVAANVLAHGTGAINIDGCRVGTDEVKPKDAVRSAHDSIGTFREQGGGARSSGSGANHAAGRWPANVIHDGSDEVLEAFAAFGGDYGRFFYSSKAGAKDRIVRNVEEVTIEWTSEQGPCRVKLQADTEQSLQKAIVVSGSTGDSEWSTFLFGSGITDLFRTASKCITSTKTSSITELRTWNFLIRSLTSASIADVSCETESGGSPVGNAGTGTQSLTITLGKTASLPGASLALSGTQLRISASARKHSHPTCKPISLMRYLCKLVTPPGGTVLDMFAGSGTTLQAAIEEGFHAIGIEREAEYHADILRRLELARQAMAKPAPKPKAIRIAKPKPKKAPKTDNPTLFDLMMCESA